MNTEKEIEELRKQTETLREIVAGHVNNMKRFVDVQSEITTYIAEVYFDLILALAENIQHVTGFDKEGFHVDCQRILDDNATPSERVQKFMDQLDLDSKMK